MFETILVANRGEIAGRVIRTLRRLGIRSVAVFSDADAGARHVRDADLAVRLGPAPARESYLHIGRILDVATSTGASAIHPGYGFLAENAAFAQACADAGLTFIGPSPHAIEVMGDKIRAKQAVAAAGVAVVPGRTQPDMTDADLVDAAADVGYPVLVKPSAGGGGKGMRLVTDPRDLRAALHSARREAAASFGDDTLFVERFVARPRHIEVQVLADGHGTTVHLGERECSLQRRHQKVIEEAPSPLLDAATRARIGASACATARSVDYQGAGTVEFIVSADRPDDYFFMEMNTRLQVEHPVTEMVTGLDLVEEQIRVAAGGALTLTQDDVRLTGHAIEARLYAEDPERGFLPTGGRALVVREPHGEGIRVDSGLTEGSEVGTTYDPMLSKIIAWGPDRDTALARLDRALAGTVVLGFVTNLTFLQALLRRPDVRAGDLDTGLVERAIDEGVTPGTPVEVHAAYALLRLEQAWPITAVVDPWDVPSGWRPDRPRPIRLEPVGADGTTVPVTVRGAPAAAWVRVGDGDEVAAALYRLDDHTALALVNGRSFPFTAVADGPTTWIAGDGATWSLTEAAAARRRHDAGAAGTEIRSPMPGAVIAVNVAGGDSVEAGEIVLVIGAMKMEYSLPAPIGGRVEVLVEIGDQVALDQVVARLAAVEAEADAGVETPASKDGTAIEAVTEEERA
jgi:acetyl-CoA/propionyl-CoA carboxylase biotin carboxyl carrier protein